MTSPALDRFDVGRPTERERLRAELAEASASRDRATGWLIGLGAGPATFVAVGAALAFGHPSLAFPLAALGCGVQVVRVCRARRDVDRIRRALQDPMDGS